MIEGAYQRFASRMCSATQVAALIVALLSSPVAGVELGRGDVKRMFEIDRYILSAEAQLAIGEYVSARQSALDAYNLLARSTADKESVLGLRAIGMLGATLVRLNERNKAIQSFKEGAALIPKIVNESEPRTRDWFLTTGFHVMQFYARMAEAQMLAGELLDADRSLADASVLTQSSGISDSFLFLHINRLKAQLALVRNQPEVAQKLFENSLDIVGNFILQMRINPSAASVLKDFPKEIFSTFPRDDRIQFHAALADALAGSGNRVEAIRHYLTAIKLIEETRVQAAGSDALSALFSPYARIYDAMITALYGEASSGQSPAGAQLLGIGKSYPEIALYMSEAAHARAFAERYGPRLIKSFGLRTPIPSTVLESETKLRGALVTAADPLMGVYTGNVGAVQSRSEAATRAYVDFLDALHTKYPEFAARMFPRPIRLGELPSLPANHFVVVYKVTDAAVYWWVLWKSQIVAFDRAATLRRDLRTTIQAALLFNTPAARMPAVDALSKQLVNPPFRVISDLVKTSNIPEPRVVIVPDDALYFIPFEALGGPDGNNVGANLIVSYVLSLTVLSQVRGAASDAVPAKSALLVGDVLDKPVTIAIDGRPRTFPPLPPDEVRRIVPVFTGAHYAASVLYREQATKAALLRGDLASFAYIHLGTHGFAQSLNPPPSLIMYSASGAPADVLLTLSDIVQLRLRATLVTLSACETGLGQAPEPIPGEGLEGMTQAFLLAGSKSVMVSLWKVDAAVTAQMMEIFYKELLAGRAVSDPAKALFLAKKELRRRGVSNPAEWAPFILVGDPGK